ncbi:Nucleoprotein TPR [Leucoagaricus sp. SymC.cos]|nr:Nucleoprotein TPR [Leucoagaricus sp. SymC.cos]
MMKTRHKRKAQEGTSQSDESLTIFMPDDIDLAALSNLLPDTSITSPSPDAIVALYRLLLGQSTDLENAQQELENVQAEVEKKDVELDQALQDRETAVKEADAQVEAVQEELKKTKAERDELATFKSKLQSEISELQNSRSQSSAETETLKHRVEDIEREKRDLVGVISRLKEESAQRADEVTTLRANLKEARQEHQKLETQIRDLRSTETSNKFKIDTLTQQLDLAQAEAKRNSDELNAKIEEFTKYRRTKHAELTTLQAAHDSLAQTAESAQASLKALQSAHSTQSHQLTQALAKVQDLTGQLAEQETKFANEAGGLKRLVSLMEEREKQAKEIVENLENEWAGVGQKAEAREAVLKDEIEKERRGREEAEKRTKHLEAVVEGLGRGELPMPGRTSLPGTPMRTPGTPADPFNDGMLGLSPTIAIASRTQKSGKTFTEVYTEYVKLKEDYAKKVIEYDNMDRTLQSVLAQIQERAPILSQQRAEYHRLQTEASELAKQLSQVITERDAQSSLAQETSQKYNKITAENKLLQQQLNDLGRQIQNLLREIARRDDPTIPSDEDLEQVVIEPVNVDQVITNSLVLFKNIGELQMQNQQLLSVVRDLGAKLEGEEREYKEAMEREQAEAVREAHEAIQELASTLEREKKHHEKVVQAYTKEREALKAMVARAEKSGVLRIAPPPPSVEGSVVRAIENGTNGTAAPADEQEALVKELTEVQNQFEAYRTEMGLDTLKLREDLVQAQREATTATAAFAKAEAKVQYMTERSRMHQEQLDLRYREVENLTKRNNQLQDQWTRLDIECNRLTEDLQVATGRIEQLRNENANLRAEKDIWQGTQNRLLEENRALSLDRAHLSDLIANVQKMHNDLERSGENDRRRLENQLQLLESQTQDLRAQLTQERDTVRNLQLQKELDLKDLQNRLDKVAEEYSRNRESLLAAEMTKKHLEEKVDDMKKRLQGNEEKLAVYERRTGSFAVPQNTDESLSREQQLEAEVAELRSAIKVTEHDLANAKEHVHQYQEISKANEEALSNLSNTFDEYKASTEAQAARHETEKTSLEEKLGVLQQELDQVKAKYQELQQIFDSERTAWANDKKLLEGTIVDMSTSEKHSEEDKTKWEQDLKAQEQRAKAAEDRYSNELVAHAESIKTIEALRKDLSATQTAARDNSTAAETAQAKLAASESSWKQQKEALDKEISDLSDRCKDLSSQNNILHQHLESVSTQAARIRQAAGSTSEAQAAETQEAGGEDSDAKLAELRSVVSWLRREKGIVDLQLQLASDENARLKRQIEHLSKSLQETQATLSEEREKAVESAASAAQHAELVERITQLNILRESNATLRADCENYAKKSRELETQLRKVTGELEPAQEQTRVTQAELEVTKAQLTRLEEESRKWQERNAQLLSKYDRIDPTSNNDLEAKKTELETAEAKHKQTLADATARLDNFKTVAQKNNSIFKSRMEQSRLENVNLTGEKQKLEERVKELEAEISALQASKATSETTAAGNAVAAKENAEQAATIILTLAALTKERDDLFAEKEKWTKAGTEATAAPLSTDAAAWEKEKAELAKARDEATEKLKATIEDARKAVEEAKSLRFQNEKFQARLHDLLKSKQADAERAAAQQATAVTEAVEKLKSELGSNPSVEEKDALVKKHANELATLQKKLVEQHEKDLKAAVDAAVETAKKETPAAATVFDKQAVINAAIAEYDAKVRAQHEAEIESAVERGRREQMTKGKLKDAQLAKAQKRVKDLEAQILEWKNTGVLPQDATVTSAPATVPPTTPVSTTTPAPAAPSAPAAQTTQPAASTSTAPAPQQGQAAPLPRKPSLQPGAAVPGRGGVPNRGRGGPPLARGAAARIPPVRATPAQQAVAATTSSHPPAVALGSTQGAGMSIMGAANKRPREEGAAPTEDSLAKRLKPLEGAAKGPVTIRRPLPGT